MISEIQRRIVWEGWFSAEVCAGYFAELSGGYRRWQTVATWGTLVASSGALATALARAPDQLSVAFAVAVAGLSIYQVLARNDHKAIDAADLSFRWTRLAAEYRALWMNQYEESAGARLDDLEARRAEISRAGTAYPNNQRRIRHWYEQVKASLAYATAASAA